jgi:hypothetical protein
MSKHEADHLDQTAERISMIAGIREKQGILEALGFEEALPTSTLPTTPIQFTL